MSSFFAADAAERAPEEELGQFNAGLIVPFSKLSQRTTLAMLYDYKSNPPLYASWQQAFRQHQPPTLIVWGKNDYIFPESGAHPYKRDLQDVEAYILDTGHFALEEHGDVIAEKISKFFKARPKIS